MEQKPITKEEYSNALDIVNAYNKQMRAINKQLRENKDFYAVFDPETPIKETGITVRCYNALKLFKCKTISDVAEIPLETFRKAPTLGRKTVHEIEILIENAGLSPIYNEADKERV